MLNKLFNFYIVIFVIGAFLISCSSKKNTVEIQPDTLSMTQQENDQDSKLNSDIEFSAEQMNYQLKKLNSELNYLKEQVMDLDIKSSLYADPFDVYNKEIILNNGSSIFCKILSQDDNQILVETLIGNLTIDRSSVVRIVENITVLDEKNEELEIVEISQDTQAELISDADLIKQRQAQSSASVILIEDIKESKDKSGNTILQGDLKNIGTQRADLVRVDFILRKNFQGDIETITTYVHGSSHVFKNTGVISNSSIEPGAIASFKMIIPNNLGNFIGYSYQIEWDYYE